MSALRKRVDGLEAQLPPDPDALFIERIVVTPDTQAEWVHSLWGDGVRLVRASDESESRFRARFEAAHRPVAEAKRASINARHKEV